MDLARLAGVARATVSYVVNELTGWCVPISEETRQRVLAAIDELAYVPDTRAQTLRSGSTKTIGLVIPDIHNPHFWEIADGVEKEAHAAGYHILLSVIPPESGRADDIFKDLAHRRIDGLIMVPSFLYESKEEQNTLSYLAKRRVTMVRMMSDRGGAKFKFDRVISDTHRRIDQTVDKERRVRSKDVQYLEGTPAQCRRPDVPGAVAIGLLRAHAISHALLAVAGLHEL